MHHYHSVISSRLVNFDKISVIINLKKKVPLNDIKHFEFYLTCHSAQICIFVAMVTD